MVIALATMRLLMMKIALDLAALSSVAGLALPVQSLNDQPLTFPRDAIAPRSIFVVTLSKAASEQGAAWTRRLREATQITAPVFQVAVLEDVPSLLRGLVISAIARQVPPGLRDRFWIAVSGGADWRKCVDSASEGDAHVFVLDQRSDVVWRAHGLVSDARISEIIKLPNPSPAASGLPPHNPFERALIHGRPFDWVVSTLGRTS